VFISFWSSKRIRPIYRAVRKDAEIIDGRVGETFSGIRVVRAFSREARELVDYMTGRHTILRKELFAHRRELALWTSWGLMTAMVNVVIVWYGGYLNVQGRASVGDIMAFQWYTFLLMNPVWNIVNSFSELQRSLAAMERVFEVLAMENEKPDRPDAIDAPDVVKEIQLENVEFEYREGRPVVQDFNVSVPGGSVVALVDAAEQGRRRSPTSSRAFTIRRRGGFSSTVRTSGTSACAPIAICSRSCSRTSFSSTAPCATTSPTAASMRRMRRSWTPRIARMRTSSSRSCRRATRRSSVSAA
jgi:hypothetical protein